LSPVGSYYPEGFNPVKIFVEDYHSRVCPGGLGWVKTAANYAASIYASEKAKSLGYTQVLWLDSSEKKWIEEVGTMNIFIRINDELITPPLEGTILPGITRDSVITLAKERKIKVVERKISIDEVCEAHKNKTLKEVFGSGTAAVISPVGEMRYKDCSIILNDFKVGEWSKMFYDTLTSIQYGKIEDSFNWTTVI
ncbi:MAG: aminotransferase class IV, partial [Ignavibacteria bacterium]|nr:aminotransferase class IV [Ignavibacteria bacterium]